MGASRILLTGVPGTGKTTLAAHLQGTAGFHHVDMEEQDFAPRYRFKRDPDGFLAELDQHPKLVVSWGFGPFSDIAAVNTILQRGFTAVWLDGNRVASFREFMRREQNDPVMEAAYYDQMKMVVVTDIVAILNPRIVNPFDESGAFRPTADIAEEILNGGTSCVG